MTKNNELVQRFINELYVNDNTELSEMISAKFKFLCQQNEQQGFEEYINSDAKSYKHRDFKIVKLISLDDVNFLVTFSVNSDDKPNSTDVRDYGIALVVVKNNAIELLQIRIDQKMAA